MTPSRILSRWLILTLVRNLDFFQPSNCIVIIESLNLGLFYISVLGLDVVTSESLFGYETVEYKEDPSASTSRPSEADQKVVIPDTSGFLSSPGLFGPSITFPKYNNYMADPSRFDPYSKIRVPLDILGIKSLMQGELNVKKSLVNRKAVLSYVQYKQLGALLPQR